MQMLWAALFALTTLDAVRGAASVARVDVIIIISIPIMVCLLGVHRCSQVRDGDVLRAAGSTIAAGRARNEIHALENLLHTLDGIHLPLIKEFKILHIAEIVLHLREIAHARKNHHNAGEARGKADGIARGAAAVQVVQDGLGLLREINQVAALERFHDNNRLAVLAADLVAGAALHRWILEVHIVKLDLHDLDLRAFVQNLIEHLRAVVEGHADMAHLALCFQGKGSLIGAARLEMLEAFRILRVHQKEVKISHTAGRKLRFKQWANVLLFFELVSGQLC